VSRRGEDPAFGAADPPGGPEPEYVQAECYVLAAVLHQPQRYATLSKIVGPEHFAGPGHSSAWATIGVLLASGKPVNPFLIAEKVGAVGGATRGQLTAYLESIAANLGVHDAEAEESAQFVRREAGRRRRDRELEAIIREAAWRSGDPGLAAFIEKDAPALAAALVAQAPRLTAALAEEPAPESSRLAAEWADEVELQLSKPGLVDGLLPAAGMTVLYGESGAGKTFATVDIACHIAAGLAWRGLAVEKGIVVYVAAEAPESVKRRLWAWKVQHQVEHLPVLVVTSSVDLLNGDAAELVALLKRVQAQHGRIALTVVDTLARAMTGNENAPEDMGRFVAACAMIREACEGHVLIVHHSGKDAARGARGHSSLRAATDVEIEVTSGDDGGCIQVTKNRDEEDGKRFGFKLEVVELGPNAKGRMVTTCVAAEAGTPAGTRDKAGQKRLTQSGKIALRALRAAIAAAGERPPQHEVTQGVASAVKLTVWRSYFAQTYGEEADETGKEAERKAFRRGRESARAAGAVMIWGEWAWAS
jgi:hypothetical protein